MSSASVSGGRKRGIEEVESATPKRPKLKTEVAETLARCVEKFGACTHPPIPIRHDAVKELGKAKMCVLVHMQVTSEGPASLKTAQFDLSTSIGTAKLLRERGLECTTVTAAINNQGARPARSYFINVAVSSRTFGEIAKGWNRLSSDVAFRLLAMDADVWTPTPYHLSIDAFPPFISQSKLASALTALGIEIEEFGYEGDEDFGALVDPLRLVVKITETCNADLVDKIKNRKLALPLTVLGVPLKLESGRICGYCGDESHSKRFCPVREKLKDTPAAAVTSTKEAVKAEQTTETDAPADASGSGPVVETGAQKGAYPRGNGARNQYNRGGRGGGQWRGGRSQYTKQRGPALGN